MSFEIEIPRRDNPALAQAVQDRWNSLTKPPGSLGRLESLVLEYALMHGTATPPLQSKTLVVFCADHGVTAESVSAWPSEVTTQMVKNFVRGGAAISVLCRKKGIKPVIVDAGVNSDVEIGVLDRKISRGTRNLAREPAMTVPQVEIALRRGADLALELAADVAGIGEMGIGNTTAASALLCAFAGVSPEDSVGNGAGLNAAGVRRKIEVVRRALELHRPDSGDRVRTLAALGGFEIAMMTGFLLGAATRRLPVVVDGFIAGAAALAARSIHPGVLDYLIFSHRSAERAHGVLLDALDARPLLDLEMRLGEGTGAALAIDLLEAALGLYKEMATFTEAQVATQP